MSNIYRTIVVFLLAALVGSCTTPNQPIFPEIQIIRHPEPLDLSKNRIYAFPPVYDPQSQEQWQVDLRSSDLTKLDLSKSGNDLLYADFDSKTKWPAPNKMPGGLTGKKSWSLTRTQG